MVGLAIPASRPRNVCPECRAGKCDNCLGDAWDVDEDVPVVCECWSEGHFPTRQYDL
jgi:hypothetical protein